MEDDSVVQDAGRRADPPLMVVALGGNAISRAGDEPSVGAQFARTRATVDHLLALIAAGDRRMVLTHGNGPQVGNILLRSDLAAEAGELPPLPVDSAVADTQGAMGYMIQQCLANALWESGIDIPVATVVTQVIVDEEDPAFTTPAKPIGRFYEDGEVDALERHGWTLSRDPQGRGWRRVIASPSPREIVEVPVIRELVDAGVLVIACGGGGVPVIAGASGALQGIEAVIDKDRCQPVPDCTVDEGGRHRRIDSAAETEQDPAIADRLLDLEDGVIDEVLRGPVGPTVADVDEEIAQ